MSGDGVDAAAIGQSLGGALVAGATVLGVLRTALAKWNKAQEEERAARAQRAEAEKAELAQRSQAEKAEYRQVVKEEMRSFTVPLLRRLAHLEGAVETLLKVRTRPGQRKRGDT